ncbi:MAG: hypothetical protein VKL00_10185 [Synechococcales bacterium]|nr:hypothetical protein [Synechococcales bacterium]
MPWLTNTIEAILYLKGKPLSLAQIAEVVPELVVGLEGVLLGDKGYIRPSLTTQLPHQGLQLFTPQ